MTSFSWPEDKPVYQNGWMKMRREANNPPKDPDVSFKGRTVVVTGANAGLVTEAISFQIADYSSFASVTSFARSLATSHPEIDILASNAGLAAPTFSRTSDGHETALQVNYLSHILLAILLLPTLISTGKTRTSPSRIVFTSSMAYLDVQAAHIPSTVPAKLSLREALEDPANHKKLFQYGMTKMLLQTGIQNLTRSWWRGHPRRGRGRWFRPRHWGRRRGVGFWKNDLLNEEVPNLERGMFEAISKRDWEDVVGLLEGVEPEVGRILGALRGQGDERG
ncbi:hypothetical protein KVT40_001060 [Elsinoe batatas]|uniref:Uncharacterized protein n=1 Tax=Elsinoe batatas TaxID=2601811 RepID=A0A8K0PGZ9_9PEZI|nr:hypothetical protein KVT40_001060 [Elsinoe batatas]